MGIKILVLVAICLIPLFTIPAFGLVIGVYEGQWVKYKISEPEVTATNEALRLSFEKGLDLPNFQMFGVPIAGVDWMKITIKEVSDTSYVYSIEAKTYQGTTQYEDIIQYISSTDSFSIVIPIDVNLGDKISYTDFTGELKLNSLQERFIAGEKREVFEVLGKKISQSGAVLTEITTRNFYDKSTGMLVDFNLGGVVASTLEGSATFSFNFKAIELSSPPLLTMPGEGGGCLIATATYDSELAPQVQMLREIRDNSLLQTQSGQSFMQGFNQFYYSFSPAIADYERENPVFKEAVKITITPLITSLSILNYVEIDSEAEMLSYGISLIILNVGMYFVAPAIVIVKLRRSA